MESGTIGFRIREQRELIGFSQAQIADETGITVRSQRNYETGKRIPDAEYLAAIAPLGIDINYVLNGNAAYKPRGTDDDMGTVLLLESILGITADCLTKITTEACVKIDLDRPEIGYDPSIFFNGLLRESTLFRLMVDRYAAPDMLMLTKVITEIEKVISKISLKVTPEKKASATLILYRAYKTNGHLDEAMIEDTVKLAAS
ncbi:helix-turn-helix domain-containing protein [Undibacterium flavidum]|uniref:Helix-turn-helix transcriptional regulator n=1 Tax=Undibacterium flavidum TaxID=2762297 RepID=A0ABR6Y740_9BURK|nr:helix-turn-helix transcriptional regulator [Undibacterium flavidum]MBC3872415.1 helix-turn-helix transcriptional regulator [Undibacterium flavidum]